MMPIKDTAPSRKFPFFTLLLVIANIAVFGYEISIYKHLDKFIIQYGFIPARMWQYPQGIISWFSSMFLHGGFLHIIGNMYFLWIFGDNVESRLGHFRFLFFYLFCGIAAAGTHAYFNSASLVPTVGASGAISGILGAYFVLFPAATVVTSFLIFFRLNIPAFLYLGGWFALQLIAGLDHSASAEASNVAVWAHIGGFIAGMVGLLFFKKGKR